MPTSAPSCSSLPKPATSSTLKRSAPRASNSAKVRGSEKAPKEGDCRSHDACSDGQCSSQDPSILCSLLTTPTFSLRDPIAHFQPRQHLLKRTREELVKRNNKAKVSSVGTLHKQLIVTLVGSKGGAPQQEHRNGGITTDYCYLKPGQVLVTTY